MMLDLDTTTTAEYLHHESNELGERYFSSDSIIHSFRGWMRLATLFEQVPTEWVDDIHDTGSTIGGYLIFPSDQRDGKPTINAARGTNRTISDRFDLTLECIRRHYAGEPSPLSALLTRYADFFDLFGSFESYVEFFLLQDLLGRHAEIRWWLPFDDFARSPVPESVDEYAVYRAMTTDFVHARNQRIAAWAEARHSGPSEN